MIITINKFKKIESVEIELTSLNIFIGANNSGKSSFIQGIQFSISACQTLGLLGVNWVAGNKRTLALDSKDYLYTPTSDISYLFHGKKLSGAKRRIDRDRIEFIINDEDISTINISRGKNGGFLTVLEGKALGIKLSKIDNPFCVYVPGIAGVPIMEKYEVPITVKKSATRGDSNNYLRNILFTISGDSDKWQNFISSINAIYTSVDIVVHFDENFSEYIDVYVTIDHIKLPLDSVGTGLLQVIQIFAYVEYFSPKILLLDEPDSHIHPSKQKLLAQELEKRTRVNDELKIVFSTHSRYILEALKDKARVTHFSEGKVFRDVKDSNILLDIGAADADYLFSKKELKYVVVTEDAVDDVVEKKQFLKKFLIANGLKEEEFVLHSYEGSTKADFAKILQSFVCKHIPTVKVILHIDRDQKIDSDPGLAKLRDDCRKRDIILFLTKYQEIESYFCKPEHFSKVYNYPYVDALVIFEELVQSLKETTILRISNFILNERSDLARNKRKNIDASVVDKLANEWYESYGCILTPGKELLGKIKDFIQNNLKKEPNEIINISEGLKCDDFQKLLNN